MAGRPAYSPTPADRKTVQNLAAAGVKQAVIAQCIGDYGVDEKTLRLHFRRELDISKTQVTALAMSKLVAAITAGDAWSIQFWLKCKENWSEMERRQISGPDEGPIQIKDVSAKQLLADRIARIAERRREG